MPRIDTRKFYKASLKRYAQTPQGVQWHSKDSQRIRFEMILKMLPKDLHNITLVDAGCGFGDFYIYLQQHNITLKKYIGIDCLDFMCTIAQQNTQQQIIHADITTKTKLPVADFYICSGAMNTLTKFESYLFIRNCFTHAKRGFIFNILYGEATSSSYNYFTQEDIQQLTTSLHVSSFQEAKAYKKNDKTFIFQKL